MNALPPDNNATKIVVALIAKIPPVISSTSLKIVLLSIEIKQRNKHNDNIRDVPVENQDALKNIANVIRLGYCV